MNNGPLSDIILADHSNLLENTDTATFKDF